MRMITGSPSAVTTICERATSGCLGEEEEQSQGRPEDASVAGNCGGSHGTFEAKKALPARLSRE